jgi:hypothetical protein
VTKKHFIAMAAITATISNNQTRKFVANQQADFFKSVNPNFNRATYLAACNV